MVPAIRCLGVGVTGIGISIVNVALLSGSGSARATG